MATLLQPPIDPEQAPTARELADRYVARLAELNTEVATALGTHPGDDRVPDLSPEASPPSTTSPGRRSPPCPVPGSSTTTTAAAPACCASGWRPSSP